MKSKRSQGPLHQFGAALMSTMRSACEWDTVSEHPEKSIGLESSRKIASPWVRSRRWFCLVVLFCFAEQSGVAVGYPLEKVRKDGREWSGLKVDNADWKGDAVDLKPMADLVLGEGYPMEACTVETVDGYILELYRIPRGRNESEYNGERRPAVLLWHGLLDSSATWVINGPEESLGFILADAGYDVWLANSRGNSYARHHAYFDIDTKEFWDFSFDDMAKYDLKAVVNYVLKATGESSIAYVGHSQGTTIAFLGFSEDKELASKVSLAVMLAPVLYVTDMSSPFLKYLATFSKSSLFYMLGRKQFLPRMSKDSSGVFGWMCDSEPMLCKNAYMGLVGYNPKNLNGSRWDYYMAYTPAGTSTKNLAHWAQAVHLSLGKCAMFDYGTECKGFWGESMRCNQEMYGQSDPPIYSFKNYSVPTALISGGRDLLSDVDDVKALTYSLPPDILVHSQQIEDYEHLDFTWGIDAHVKVYSTIKELCEAHQPKSHQRQHPQQIKMGVAS